MKRLLLILQLIGLTTLTIYNAATVLAGNAVSAPNGKVEVFSGRVNGNSSDNLSGSYSFPLSPALGIQVDGLYGQFDEKSLYGAGGLFRRQRDPRW